jgi:hypothetical protein
MTDVRTRTLKWVRKLSIKLRKIIVKVQLRYGKGFTEQGEAIEDELLAPIMVGIASYNSAMI